MHRQMWRMIGVVYAIPSVRDSQHPDWAVSQIGWAPFPTRLATHGALIVD